jgi:hypothetical protein
VTVVKRPVSVAESASIPLAPCGTPTLIAPHITHISPVKRDVSYDQRAHQAAIAVDVHLADGNTVESVLILTPSQVELIRIQLDQAIEQRLTVRQAVR